MTSKFISKSELHKHRETCGIVFTSEREQPVDVSMGSCGARVSVTLQVFTPE